MSCAAFLEGLHTHFDLSVPIFRLLLQLVGSKDIHHLRPCLQIVATILQLDPSKSYSSTPLTALLKQFPIIDLKTIPIPPPRPPRYEPESSPFSIANLAGTGVPPSSKPVAPSVQVTANPVISSVIPATRKMTCDVSNEDDVLRVLLITPSHILERQIRVLFETAVARGKLGVVRLALTKLLAMSVVKTENKLPRRSIALLLDWLFVLDPELEENPLQLRQMLLFGKHKGVALGVGIGGYSQAYLLGAFTQQANWSTLEDTVHNLLTTCNEALNPGGVLDFIHAVMKVPKLWQGREKRTPRHVKPPQLLRLESKQLINLARYMLAEKCNMDNSNENNSDDRMRMLIQCYGDDKSLYRNLVSELCHSSLGETSEAVARRSFLYQLYLSQPSLISFIPHDTVKIMPSVSSKGTFNCDSDVIVHCLITMISSPNSGRDFRKRLHELEWALRTLASNHPLLLLRQFHLIHTGLDGISHLQFSTLKSSNHLEVLSVFAGVLELMHPHLFNPKFNETLKATINCYFAIFEAHGTTSELSQISTRVVDFIHSWLATDRPRALLYLVPHAELLKSLSQHDKEWRSLSVAADSASGLSMEPLSDNPHLSSPPLPLPSTNWLGGEAAEVLSKLEIAATGEEKRDAWHRLSYLASRAPSYLLIKQFIPTICEGLSSGESEVRDIAWSLMSRILTYQPSLAGQFVASVVQALSSEQCSVAKTACESLPDTIIMLQASSPTILSAAFVAVTTKVPNSLSSLTKALTLLTIHTGA